MAKNVEYPALDWETLAPIIQRHAIQCLHDEWHSPDVDRTAVLRDIGISGMGYYIRRGFIRALVETNHPSAFTLAGRDWTHEQTVNNKIVYDVSFALMQHLMKLAANHG